MKTSPGLCTALAVLAMLAAVPAAAQIGAPNAPPRPPVVGPYSQTPEIAPWDKALRRFYEREKLLTPRDPLAKSERSVRGLYLDPARKLGLPDQTSPDRLRPASPTPAPGLPDDILALDRDHDGGITRREYMEQRFRNRPVAPGPAAEARRRNVIGRVRARFDGVDTNRDGILSADELKAVIDPRF